MFVLENDDTSIITLGQLREFITEICRSLPNDTPITISSNMVEQTVVPCITILADKESVELYNF